MSRAALLPKPSRQSTVPTAHSGANAHYHGDGAFIASCTPRVPTPEAWVRAIITYYQ